MTEAESLDGLLAIIGVAGFAGLVFFIILVEVLGSGLDS